jgi:branched-chain amino acid transport system substrate-binding protein
VAEGMLMKLVVRLAVAALASTPNSSNSFGAADDRPVVIGAMYNLTGGQHDLDIPSSEGARLAVDQANAGKGILGRQVKMVLVDGETRPEVIERKARALFRDQPAIAGLIGFSDTDVVLAAATVAAEHDRVFLTSGATSPLLPAQVPEYLFLACFGDNVQAAAAAEWAYETLKARTVAVLYKQESTYAQLLHAYFGTRFKELGGEVMAVVPYTLDPAEFRSKVGKLPAADVIYLAAQPDDVALAVPALREAGIETPILGGDGLDIGEAWVEVADAREIYFTTHAYLGADNKDSAVREFRAAFAKAHPDKEPDGFTALGYDAARLLMSAIETAGSTDPEAVREALASTSGFKGVTGTIGFATASRIPSKSVTIMEVDGGRQRFVGEVLPKKVPPPR